MELGDKLGRYEIREKIGAGGMGEVFRASDSELDRDVALKVLLPEFCDDGERVKRFKFEAKAVSALNHPGIITIHEIVQEDERLFIATEFVDGITVREKIEEGGVSLFEAVRIAEQVADALAVAHDANIVHRDIKPENIMIRNDGYVKILDFGLAKPILQSAAGAEDATIQMVKTQPGIVMGSVRYMSPEQARGKDTDGRTDVWSLGIVLYEMITGHNPFEGETISDSIAALIHKDPEPLVDVPEELRWIIRKALNKNPDERFQDIKDLALDLKNLRVGLEHGSGGNSTEFLAETSAIGLNGTSENKTLMHRTVSAENKTDVRTTSISRRRTGAAARGGRWLRPTFGVVAVFLAAVGGWYFSSAFFGAGTNNFQSLEVSTLTDNGRARAAAVSPDGRLVVFVDRQGADPRLVVQQIASGGIVEIVPPTEKQFLQPVFSPDGNFVYYTLRDKGVGTLYRVSSLGGAGKRIVVDIDSKAAVSSDGKRIAFIRHDPEAGGDTVFVMNSGGEDLTAFIQTKPLGYNKFIDVVWTDGDENLLISGFKSSEAAYSKINLVTVNAESGKSVESIESRLLNERRWAFAGSFSLLNDGSGLLFIGKKDPDDTLQIWHLRYSDERINSITTDTSVYESLSVSSDGRTMIATKADRISGLVAYDSGSKVERQVKSESRNFVGYLGVTQMPDGRLLYSKRDGKNVNIYAIGEDGLSETRLTNESGINLFPISTPDGKYIVYSAFRDGANGIWKMDADGGNPVALTKVENGKDLNPQISGKGKAVVFSRQKNDGSQARLMTVSLAGGDAKELFPKSKNSNMMPRLTADGKRLAFVSFEFDARAAELTSGIQVAEMEGGSFKVVGERVDMEMGHWFQWSPAGDAITYVKKDGGDNIFELSLDTKKETALTSFDSGTIMSFLWSRDGRTLFAVKGVINSDLVLIKNHTEV